MRFVLLAMLLAAVAGAQTRTWDFEQPTADWQTPGLPYEIVLEPGTTNHVAAITSDRPHHTQMVLKDSEQTPDFLATLRYKQAELAQGAATFFLYGRSTRDGFRYVSSGGQKFGASAYFGMGNPSISLGGETISGWQGGEPWVWVKVAYLGDRLFAKSWVDGTHEPRWQIQGAAEGQPTGSFAFGVWTSPREPSKATYYFDDVSFQPLAADDLEGLGVRIGQREPLDLGTVPQQVGPFQAAGLAGLVTPRLVATIETKTGDLAHLVDRASGTDFVVRDVFRPLFELRLTKPYENQAAELSAWDFRQVTCQPDHGALSVTFAGHPTYPLVVKATAAIAADGKLQWRLAVDNPTDWAVQAVTFPGFVMPADIGPGDECVVPWGDGAILPNPGRVTHRSGGTYPGSASFQFAARCGTKAGLYCALEDPAGEVKRWRLSTTQGKEVEFAITHLQPEVPKPQFSLPYPIVFDTFRGDWHAAAAIYRQWAEQQPWCATKLADRTDIPAFLKEGSGIIITGIMGPKGYNGGLGEQLERPAEWSAAYRRKTGLKHLVFIPYGWEGNGTWAGLRYFPACPSNDAWVKINQQLRAQGDRTAMLTSGYWWVVKRQQTGSGPAFDDTADFERRQSMVVHRADGSPFLLDCYDQVKQGQTWRGLSAELCHGSAEASVALKEIFLECARLGTPLVSFDQEIGGGQREPCYDRSHGHPPGYGSYMWTGFRDLCAEILKEGKPIQPELGLFLENVSELAIPYLATYWSRQFSVIDYGGAGLRSVGLFSYLYHDYVTAIGAACVQGQGPKGRPAAPMRVRALAYNLIRGLIPGPFMHDVQLDAQDPWHQAVTAGYLSYCRPYASFPQYLLLGRSRPPLQVASESVDVPYGEKGKLPLPAVEVGTYEAADGSLGTVVVNATDQPQTATVTLPGATEVFAADGTRLSRAAGPTLELTIEAYGTRMLVSRPAN